jgi:hypothetical protein
VGKPLDLNKPELNCQLLPLLMSVALEVKYMDKESSSLEFIYSRFAERTVQTHPSRTKAEIKQSCETI